MTDTPLPTALSVLIATDLTPRAAPALARAARLRPARVTLLHVTEADLPAGLQEDLAPSVQAALSHAAAVAGLPEQVILQIRAGHAHVTICDSAAQLGADLILMGRHRQETLGDVLTGTTLERVIRHGGPPVLICQTTEGKHWRRVLVATDLSPASVPGLDWLARSGLLRGAEVTLAYAFHPLGQGLARPLGATGAPATDHETRDAEAALVAFAEQTALAPLSPRLRLVAGAPTPALTALMAQDPPDLLVMGTHGPSGLLRGLIGSVAQALLRGQRCDMLVLPTPAPRSA